MTRLNTVGQYIPEEFQRAPLMSTAVNILSTVLVVAGTAATKRDLPSLTFLNNITKE